ncbi:hypothetical protein BC835DRAFT_1302109 [Cytidiella melzeri]|nr:hypothetical protein BC835DRAFT_1302109 [Cytidiella melzeri]
MSAIPLDKAYLSAIWLETFLSFSAGVSRHSPYTDAHPQETSFLLAVSMTMFTFSTAHVSLGFQQLIEGFIVLQNQPGGPGAFFSDISIPAKYCQRQSDILVLCVSCTPS